MYRRQKSQKNRKTNTTETLHTRYDWSKVRNKIYIFCSWEKNKIFCEYMTMFWRQTFTYVILFAFGIQQNRDF